MLLLILLLMIGAIAPAQSIPAGVPLRVALESRVPVKHVGEPVRARLVEPVFVFDHLVLPADSLLLGRVSEIGGISLGKRLSFLLSGNLTPPRGVWVQFDTLIMESGTRLPLAAPPSQGTRHTARTTNRGKDPAAHPPALQRVRSGLGAKSQAAILAFKSPGKADRLKARLWSMLPYHRHSLSPGTLFAAVPEEPLQLPASGSPAGSTHPTGAAVPEDVSIRARLLTPIGSATARPGLPVEAVITEPLFSPEHRLLIPEGSRLVGEVTQAQPARLFHRTGKLNFVFREVRLPSGATQKVQGYLEGLEADFEAHLAVDAEGAIQVSSPKSRFIFPAVAVAVAGLSMHQDYNAEGVPDQDIAGRAESGAVGLGLIGTAVAQSSRVLASCLAFTGAGFSVYTNFLARGRDVVLPLNTPVEVSLQTRANQEQPAAKGKTRPRPGTR